MEGGQRSAQSQEQRRDKSAYRQQFSSFEALPNVFFCPSFLFLVRTGSVVTSGFSSGLLSLFSGYFLQAFLKNVPFHCFTKLPPSPSDPNPTDVNCVFLPFI